MADQNQSKAQASTRLLQKIFIVVSIATYAIDSILRLRSQTTQQRLFIELLLFLLVPVGYFILSYLISSRKPFRLLSVFQSLVASIAAYAFWNTLTNIIQNFHRTYTANLKMYFLTAIITGFLLIAVLLYLRLRKDW
jgi:glucan phosphoethanolaminetransferase (alkaline phosphatase superfamily)